MGFNKVAKAAAVAAVIAPAFSNSATPVSDTSSAIHDVNIPSVPNFLPTSPSFADFKTARLSSVSVPSDAIPTMPTPSLVGPDNWGDTTKNLTNESTLTWYPDMEAPIDPFSLVNEFRDEGPLIPQTKPDSDSQPDDLDWDTVR